MWHDIAVNAAIWLIVLIIAAGWLAFLVWLHRVLLVGWF